MVYFFCIDKPIKYIAQARWLRAAQDRPPESVMENSPPFQSQYCTAPCGPNCLTLLGSGPDGKILPKQIYLFSTRQHLYQFLLSLPSPQDRRFFLYLPDNRPIAFQLDIDKDDKDPRWLGHVNHPWEKVKSALKFFIGLSYWRLTRKKKFAPAWESFDFRNPAKSLSFHLHSFSIE